MMDMHMKQLPQDTSAGTYVVPHTLSTWMKPACDSTPCTPGLYLQVGSVLGALVYNGSFTEEQASDLVSAAARASAGPGGSNTLQRLTRNMWAAVSKQRSACRRAEEQAEEARQKEAEQLAELHQPKVHSPFLLQRECLLISQCVMKSPAFFSWFPFKLFLAIMPAAWLQPLQKACSPLIIVGAFTCW